MAGQGTFLRNGLMEYGSIFGHGVYLGPDYTADYLHRSALISIDFYNGQGSDRSRAVTIENSKTSRYDKQTDTLVFTAAQANAFDTLQSHYHTFFAFVQLGAQQEAKSHTSFPHFWAVMFLALSRLLELSRCFLLHARTRAETVSFG
jgi:nitric oxide reductase large subunit